MPAGRPEKVTDEILQKLKDCFKIGATDEEACCYAEICCATLYNYQKAHPEFLEIKEQLKQKPVLKARKTVVESLDDPNMAMQFLTKKKRDEFGNILGLEMGGASEANREFIRRLSSGQEGTGEEADKKLLQK